MKKLSLSLGLTLMVSLFVFAQDDFGDVVYVESEDSVIDVYASSGDLETGYAYVFYDAFFSEKPITFPQPSIPDWFGPSGPDNGGGVIDYDPLECADASNDYNEASEDLQQYQTQLTALQNGITTQVSTSFGLITYSPEDPEYKGFIESHKSMIQWLKRRVENARKEVQDKCP